MGDPHKRNGESAEKEGDATEEWQTATGEERKEIMEVSAPKNSEEAGQGKEPEETEDKDEDLMEIEEEEDFDVFAVADVTDRGNGVPLFADFAVEDWALLSLRFELHLLVHAFRRDVNDPERLGIHDTNVAFYYNKYYRKVFNTKCFGVDTNAQLVDLVSDSVMFNPKTNVLESLLSDDLDNFDIFVKLSEEERRERQRLIDSGDTSAVLKFQKTAGAMGFPAASIGEGRYANALGAAPLHQQHFVGHARPGPYLGVQVANHGVAGAVGAYTPQPQAVVANTKGYVEYAQQKRPYLAYSAAPPVGKGYR